MRSQTKQHPGPPGWGWAWGRQLYLIKNCTATETPRHIPTDTTAWGVDGPLERRLMTPAMKARSSWRSSSSWKLPGRRTSSSQAHHYHRNLKRRNNVRDWQESTGGHGDDELKAFNLRNKDHRGAPAVFRA